MNDRGEWTPEEAEEAFKIFGNFFLQVNAVYSKHGTRTPENTVAGAQELMNYLQGQSVHQLTQLSHFLLFISLFSDQVQAMIEMILLRRSKGL